MGTTKTTFAMYWRAAKHYRWQVTVLLTLLPIAALASPVAIPYFVSQIITELINFSNGDEATRNQIVRHVFIVGFLLFVDLVAWRTIAYVMSALQVNVLRDLEAKVHRWLLQLSYSFHIQSFSGSLIAKGKRFVNEYERISETVYYDFIPIGIKLAAISVVLSFQSLTLTALFAVWMISYVAFMFFLSDSNRSTALLLQRPIRTQLLILPTR